MKRIIKVFCALLLLLLLAALALAWWQRDNLKALYKAKTEDAETILREAQTQLETHQKELEQYNVVLKAPTQEEKDALLSGKASKKTEEEKKDAADVPHSVQQQDSIKEAEASDPPEETPEEAPPETSADAPPDGPSAQELLESCIRELYDCELALMERLGVMRQAAVDEWNALPAGQRVKSKKLEIGYRGLDECYKLEVEIDAQVKAILAKYRTALENIGADTAPLDTLWTHYCDEKASTKAYYMNKYL